MKIQILSDLHLEHEPLMLPPTDAEVIVLAGDISTGFKLHELLKHVRDDQHILMVAGNHEYYNYDIEQLQAQFRKLIKPLPGQAPRFHFLDNDQVVINSVRFLGTTLWTDFDLNGQFERDYSLASAARGLNDFRRIRYRGRTFTPEDSRELHLVARAWLEEQLATDWPGKTVVVTHHAPTAKAIAPHFEGDRLSPCFASRLESLMDGEKAQLWIYGHTHHPLDTVINGTRVISNPRGYARGDRNENERFDPAMVVEI